MRELTPEIIHVLPKNSIFVFGSNAQGKHGLGAAKIALNNFGAKYGQAKGLQGQSYAIITKKDYKASKSSTLLEIAKEISDFLLFAIDRPDLKFYVTKIGCGLAGYRTWQIKAIFSAFKDGITDNVMLPEEFEFRD